MKTVNEILAALSAIRPLTKATIANYRRAIVYYGNFIGREPLLSDLNEQRVSEWLRQEEARYPASYVRNLLIALNPSNGWGSYETFLPWLRKYLEACIEYPKASISASK